MTRRILLAGAGGVVGRRLVPLLIAAGYEVFGTTRSPARANELRDHAIEPLVVDVFDAAALARAAASAAPDVVIHQLTDLPPGLDPARMADAIVRNARIRQMGTRNLVDAAIAAGARRIVAQSIAWAYAVSALPHAEDDPLDVGAEGARGVSVRGVAALESAVLESPPIDGIVLRYGHLYGPGTGTGTAADPALHVDAAAQAALLAVDHGAPGIYNVAEASREVATVKARSALGFDAGFRNANATW